MKGAIELKEMITREGTTKTRKRATIYDCPKGF